MILCGESEDNLNPFCFGQESGSFKTLKTHL